MPDGFDEAAYENAIISLLESLGYKHLYGPDIERDYRDPLYRDAFTGSLPRVNPKANRAALAEAFAKITRIEHGTLVQQNKIFMDCLQNGVEVTYREKGQTKTDIIHLVDYLTPENNAFHVINQWTVQENDRCRPDVVVFVNGLPLVVIELKSCAREGTDYTKGYTKLKNYMEGIPCFFVYNAFCITSDLINSKVGTITAELDRFVSWKAISGDHEETSAFQPAYAQYHVLFEGMLEQRRFLDIVKHFILFSTNTPEDKKILAGYHQYFAVKKAIESTVQASGCGYASVSPAKFKTEALSAAETVRQADGKGGVFWHTQGSGKSLSMVFYAALLQTALSSPTIIVITDRNDLDDQLYEQFALCKDFLRQTPERALDRKHLRRLLNDRQANGIFFTTMQKFEESAERNVPQPLSTRRNIVVMADEAHRSQYGLTEKVGKDGKIKIGAARIIRDSLPNATFIGFTGTPVSSKDRNTREVFGDYIDIYDMTQSVEDGATRPVYYESRVMNLGLDADVLRQIDEIYELLALNADESNQKFADIERSKRELGTFEEILGAPETIASLCSDIINHYETNRAGLLAGKAMIVAYSRPVALNIYRKILELRPLWTEKVKVVMTSNNDNDPKEWREIIRLANKTERPCRHEDGSKKTPQKIQISAGRS